MKSQVTISLITSTVLFTACSHIGRPLESNRSEGTRSNPGKKLVLTTSLPPQQKKSTAKLPEVPRLAPVSEQAPVLRVPESTVLLSAGKPVSASDDFPIIGEFAYITDGNKQAENGYFVELLDRVQWIQIDLEEPAEIHAIWFWHLHLPFRAYHDVIVQISNDPEFEIGVTTLFNNDYDNSAGLGVGADRPYIETRYGKLVDAKGTVARYIRLYSNGNTANDCNQYTEVEVFGTEF